MKIELDTARPESYVEDWAGQYDVFSFLEFTVGVPSPMFLITTRKENGQPNACLQAWSSFAGDSGGFFAVMQGLMQSTHTYRNILREKEFCLNFIRPEYYDACIKTVAVNDEEDDEIASGGFTAEACITINSPRIKESFLCMECTLESVTDLSGKGQTVMIVGRVQHASVEEGHNTIENICSPNAFMYNIHSPKDPVTGIGNTSAVGILQPV
jgi:flavin reductase (DIM6/NTAB) family NADH-FMN oxidoreductase RutF